MSTVTTETPAETKASRSISPTHAALIIAAGVLLVFSVGYQLPAPAHFMSLPVLERMVDPELYPGDYYVDEMMRFTPRFYFFNLIAGLSRLGPSLHAVFFGTYLVAFAALVFTTFTFGKTVGGSNLSGAIAAFLVVLPAEPTLGATGIFFRTPIAQTYAVPFAIWGLVQCCRSRWHYGYAMFGLAAMFQFLVGLLSGVLVTPYLLWHIYQNRSWKLLVTIPAIMGTFLSSVYLPMKLTGTADSGALSGAEFLRLYGWVRHPYHSVPSTWPLAKTVLFALALACAALCLYLYRNMDRVHRGISISILGTCAGLLVFNYVFIDVVPTAFVMKLQLGRTTPFMFLAAVGLFAGTVEMLRKDGQVWAAALLLTLLAYPQGLPIALMLLIALAAGIGARLPKIAEAAERPELFVGAALLLLSLWVLTISLKHWGEGFLVVPGGFLAMILLTNSASVSKWADGRPVARIAIWAAAPLTVVLFVMGMADKLPAVAQQTFDQKILYWDVTHPDRTALALRYKAAAPLDETVLTPPGVHDFKLDAQRPDVVNFKCIPYTDDGIVEWGARMEAVLGQRMEEDLALKPEPGQEGKPPPPIEERLDNIFAARSTAELEQVARRYNARVILTRWHTFEDAELIDQQGDWKLYRLPAPNAAASPSSD